MMIMTNINIMFLSNRQFVAMFTDEQFIQSCKELDIPDVTAWDFYIDANSTKIYRQCNTVFEIEL